MPACISSLISTAVAAPARDIDVRGTDVPVAVWDVLDVVPDPRKRRGRRHSLATVIVVALAAVAGGARTITSIGEWAADLPRWCWPRLGITRRPPSGATVRRLLIAVDPDIIDAVLSAWVAALQPPPPPAADKRGTTTAPVVPPALRGRRAVALDGKTSRGARQPDGTRVHLFSMVEHGTGIPLGQVNSHGKDHEIAAFRTLLDRIGLAGVVATADALHTQRSHANYLHYHGGKYVLTVKRNQPKLHDQLADLPWDQVPVLDQSEEKGHGRRESRTLQLTAVGAGIGFPHAKLAGRIIRTRKTIGQDKTSREVVYVVTSLDWKQGTAAEIAGLVRGHWSIENCVHWIRDLVFDEDRHQLRTGNAPRTMACLRNTVLGLIRTRMPGRGIAAATRELSRRAERVLAILDNG